MIFRKLERSDRQTCFGTFIRRTNKTSNSSNHTCHWCLYQKHHAEEEDPLGQVCLHFDSSRKGNLSSALLPDTVSMAATALGSATVCVLHLRGGAGLQQQRDHLDVALLRCQVQWRSASGRRPRGSPHGSRRERTRVVGKLTSASCASLKSHTPTVQHKHCTPSDKRMPGETQGEEGAVGDEEAVTRGWKGLCPGELINGFSSCCGRCMTKNANITQEPEPIMAQIYPVLIWHPWNLKTAIRWKSAFALQHSSAWLTSWTSCLCAKSTHTRLGIFE